MKKWIAICALTLAACANPTPTATASDSRETPSAQHEQAKAVFDQALAAYNTQDYATALPLFRQAAAQGFFKADRYIGLAYLNGLGVAQDSAQAFAAFTRASDKDITGQYWLGYCYENGIGTTQDMQQAVYWYQKSAQRGDHVSQPAIDALKRLGIAVAKQ